MFYICSAFFVQIVQNNLTVIGRRYRDIEKSQKQDLTLIHSLNSGLGELDKKVEMAIDQIPENMGQYIDTTEHKISSYINKVDILDASLINLQSILAKLMEEADITGKTQEP